MAVAARIVGSDLAPALIQQVHDGLFAAKVQDQLVDVFGIGIDLLPREHGLLDVGEPLGHFVAFRGQSTARGLGRGLCLLAWRCRLAFAHVACHSRMQWAMRRAVRRSLGLHGARSYHRSPCSTLRRVGHDRACYGHSAWSTWNIRSWRDGRHGGSPAADSEGMREHTFGVVRRISSLLFFGRDPRDMGLLSRWAGAIGHPVLRRHIGMCHARWS